MNRKPIFESTVPGAEKQRFRMIPRLSVVTLPSFDQDQPL